MLFTDVQLSEKDVNYAKDPFPTTMIYHDVLYQGGQDDYCPPVTHSPNCDRSVPTNLMYHVVYPSSGIDYSKCKLPVIILFHGGGFIDCSQINLSFEILNLCKELAKRGFIAISVEYRSGIKVPDLKPFYTAQQMLAF